MKTWVGQHVPAIRYDDNEHNPSAYKYDWVIAFESCNEYVAGTKNDCLDIISEELADGSVCSLYRVVLIEETDIYAIYRFEFVGNYSKSGVI